MWRGACVWVHELSMSRPFAGRYSCVVSCWLVRVQSTRVITTTISSAATTFRGRPRPAPPNYPIIPAARPMTLQPRPVHGTAVPRRLCASSVQPATAVCRRMEIAVVQPRGAEGLRPTHSMLQIALLMTTRSSQLTLHTQQLLARPRPSCTRLHFSRRPSQPPAQ